MNQERDDEGGREEGRVIYSRAPVEDEGEASSEGAVAAVAAGGVAPSVTRRKRFAPTLVPLLLGFALLLALMLILGSLSIQSLHGVSGEVLDLERQYAARLGLMLRLRVGVTKLNNEARARSEAEAQGRFVPPLALRLSNAQREVTELVPLFERSTLAGTETGRAFARNLAAFLEVTADLNRYSLEGYERFQVVDRQLDELLRTASAEQKQIIRRSEELEANAANRIWLLTLLTALVGSLVAAGTIWIAQRRFRETQGSRS